MRHDTTTMNDSPPAPASGLTPLEQLASEFGVTLGSLGCLADMRIEFAPTYVTVTAELTDSMLWSAIAQQFQLQNPNARVFFGTKFLLNEQGSLLVRAYFQARADRPEALYEPMQMRLLRARVAALGAAGAAEHPRPISPVAVSTATATAPAVPPERLAGAPLVSVLQTREDVVRSGDPGFVNFRPAQPPRGAIAGSVPVAELGDGDIGADGATLPSRSTPNWRHRRYVVAVGEGGTEIEAIGGGVRS